MKVFICTDAEGVSCLDKKELINGFTMQMRSRLMADVNAAIRGAFDGGADQVIVADVHGARVNVMVEELDPRALVLSGWPRQPRFPFLDQSVDGMFLLGYHAMAGTERGNLEHTMNGRQWHCFRVNGAPWGELGIDAELAAEAGVPVVMVSGDDKLCHEARKWLGPVETAMVKQGIGRQSALCLSPERGRKVIYDSAKRAVERLRAGERFFLPEIPSPARVAITYKMISDADGANVFGTRRLDAYTVETTYNRLSELYGGIWEDGKPILI